MNSIKTVLLLTLMTLLVWWVGLELFPNGGFYYGLGFAALLNIGVYFFSDKIALAASALDPSSTRTRPRCTTSSTPSPLG